jgi:hypothetical protein
MLVASLGMNCDFRTPLTSQKAAGMTLPPDGAVLNFFGAGDPSRLYSGDCRVRDFRLEATHPAFVPGDNVLQELFAVMFFSQQLTEYSPANSSVTTRSLFRTGIVSFPLPFSRLYFNSLCTRSSVQPSSFPTLSFECIFVPSGDVCLHASERFMYICCFLEEYKEK